MAELWLCCTATAQQRKLVTRTRGLGHLYNRPWSRKLVIEGRIEFRLSIAVAQSAGISHGKSEIIHARFGFRDQELPRSPCWPYDEKVLLSAKDAHRAIVEFQLEAGSSCQSSYLD